MNRPAFLPLLAAASLFLAACNDIDDVARVTTPSSPPPAASAQATAAKRGPLVQLAMDMELSSKVKEALKVPGKSKIEVDADDGVVTLYGTVDTPADKDRIALAAMEIEGVRSVVNNLVVLRTS